MLRATRTSGGSRERVGALEAKMAALEVLEAKVVTLEKQLAELFDLLNKLLP